MNSHGFFLSTPQQSTSSSQALQQNNGILFRCGIKITINNITRSESSTHLTHLNLDKNYGATLYSAEEIKNQLLNLLNEASETLHVSVNQKTIKFKFEFQGELNNKKHKNNFSEFKNFFTFTKENNILTEREISDIITQYKLAELYSNLNDYIIKSNLLTPS